MPDTQDALRGKEAFLNFVGLGLGLFFALAGVALVIMAIAMAGQWL